MSLTHGGLFEGYGGTTMAAQLVLGDLDTRWVSDIKPASGALLAHRHPGLPNFGDLTAAFPAVGPLPRATADIEPVDVLTASWPCQPHSAAGRRLGEVDPRALWPNVARVIGELRPRLFLGENVSRIAGSGELRRVTRSLADLGYVGAWRCATAASVGAPHKRDRCFVVGLRGDLAADPDPAGRATGRGVGRAERTPPLGDDHAAGAGRLSLLPTPTQSMTTGPGTSGRDGGMNLQTAATRLLPTPRESDGPKGGPGMRGSSGDQMMPSWAVEHATSWGAYEPAIRRWEAILGRPAPSPTQSSLRAPYAPQLSATFVEWMMGLPQGWVTDVPGIAPRSSSLRNAALSLLGDGVVPQQGAAAYGPMIDHLLGIGAGEELGASA